MMPVGWHQLLLLTLIACPLANVAAPCGAERASDCASELLAEAEALQPHLEFTQRRAARLSKADTREPSAPAPPPASASGLSLQPHARWFLTSDAQASARFFTRYFRGVTATPANLTVNGSCAEAIEINIEQGLRRVHIVFVQDTAKVTGTLPSTTFLDAARKEFDKVMYRWQDYSPWVDLHDGFRYDVFNFDQAAEDVFPMEVYSDEIVYRMYIPGTAWTVELKSLWDLPEVIKNRAPATQFYIDKMINGFPDVCRIRQQDEIDSASEGIWWKATYAAMDPMADADFAVAVLGAHRVQSPYPDRPKPGCIFAQWVTLPGSTFMMHFVASDSVYPPGPITTHDLASYQEQLRNLEAGVFDRWMYNSLMLWSESLDPWVERFRSFKVPFLPLSFGEDLYGVFISFPSNGNVVVQIRSNRLTAVEAKPFDACAPAAAAA